MGPMIIIASFMGLSLLIHCIYFCCVWSRIPMAEATLTIAVTILRRYSAVMWISLAASLVTILYIFGCAFATFGVFQLSGCIEDNGTKSEGVLAYILGVVMTLCSSG